MKGIKQMSNLEILKKINKSTSYAWDQKVLLFMAELLPQKFFDGSYIQNRIIREEFSKEELNINVNQDCIYFSDLLKPYVQYSSGKNGKLKKLSAGEQWTILMIEDLNFLLPSEYDTCNLLLMAYLHDMDAVLSKYLSGKIMGKMHRRHTLMQKAWKRRSSKFWHQKSSKYLPLDKKDMQMIEAELQAMSSEQLETIFDGEDIMEFAKHVCRVIELAYGNKEFTLTSFDDDLFDQALDMLDELMEEE